MEKRHVNINPIQERGSHAGGLQNGKPRSVAAAFFVLLAIGLISAGAYFMLQKKNNDKPRETVEPVETTIEVVPTLYSAAQMLAIEDSIYDQEATYTLLLTSAHNFTESHLEVAEITILTRAALKEATGEDKKCMDVLEGVLRFGRTAPKGSSFTETSLAWVDSVKASRVRSRE